MSQAARRRRGLTVRHDLAAGDARLIHGSWHPRVLWRAFRAQQLGFQLACLYLIFEYIRPQSRFPAIDVLPWSMLVILAGLAAMLPEVNRRGWTRNPANGWMIGYLLIATISLVFAEYPAYGFSKWDFLLPWVVVYFFITNTTTTRDRFALLLLVYVLCNLRLSQFGLRSFVFSGFSTPGFGFRGPVGWFHNQGELGVQMAMFAPLGLLIANAFWSRFGWLGRGLLALLPISALITGVGTNSRGTILAMAFAIPWTLLALGVKLRTLFVVGFIGLIGFLIVSDDVVSRFQSVGTDTTSVRRLIFIEDGLQMIGDHPIVGVGYFNWMPYYIANFPPIDDVGFLAGHQLPHNILILVTAELGLLGLIVFLVLVGWSFVLNRRTRAMIRDREDFYHLISHGLDASMVAFLVAGQFVTIMYYPYFWITLSLTLALHESVRRGLKESFTSRGGNKSQLLRPLKSGSGLKTS